MSFLQYWHGEYFLHTFPCSYQGKTPKCVNGCTIFPIRKVQSPPLCQLLHFYTQILKFKKIGNSDLDFLFPYLQKWKIIYASSPIKVTFSMPNSSGNRWKVWIIKHKTSGVEYWRELIREFRINYVWFNLGQIWHSVI